MSDPADSLPEARRREIFTALVEAQDRGAPVTASRQEVADRFGVTPQVVAQVEREGLDEQWPPL